VGITQKGELSYDSIYIHIHLFDGNAGGLGKFVADLAHNTAGNGHKVHAVVDADMQLKRNAAIVIEADAYALGHGLSPQKL
jgi:hypothetical protein